MKRVLMIAYHFPPLAGSSGIQRTLRFVRHLPEFGWEPIVLSAHPRAYERTSADLMGEIPEPTVVRRAFALDTARHLSLGGRYATRMACPDRWVSWKYFAVPAGLGMIREFKPDAIWSTYPIATAHVIASQLQARTGLPWLADFRDPMAQDDYPTDPMIWKSFAAIERETVRRASLSTFTTPGAADIYRERYPDAAERIALLENGYDEDTFAAIETAPVPSAPLNPGTLTLLHSGIVYPDERDPTHLLAALALLKTDQGLRPGELKIRFRASVHDDLLRSMAEQHGVGDFIEVCPAIPYREALIEMLQADALLILQAANCNQQVPAKLYEYLRAKRPVLALTDPRGDTARTLRAAGIDWITPLDQPREIAARLSQVMHDLRNGTRLALASPAAVAASSRRARTASLAAALEAITRHGSPR